MDDSKDIQIVYREVEWLKPSDIRVLQEMAKYAGWHTAHTLSLNTPYSGNWMRQRASLLTEHKLLERHPDSAAYRITDLGRRVARGEAEPEELED